MRRVLLVRLANGDRLHSPGLLPLAFPPNSQAGQPETSVLERKELQAEGSSETETETVKAVFRV